MALDGVSVTQRTSAQPADLQLRAPSQAIQRADYYATTLVREGKQSNFSTAKLKEYFWTAWEYTKVPFVKAWEWILWIVQFCPAEKASLEILEHILEDPKAAAKEFAENPADSVGELVLAALIDPDGMQQLRDENIGAIGTFMREFKRAHKDHAKLLIGKEAGIVPALLAFIVPGLRSGHDLFKTLSKIPAKHPSLIFGALDRLGKQVLEIIGDEDKESDEAAVHALRVVFKDYLPKVVAHAQENPEEFEDFFKGLYQLRELDGRNVLDHVKSYAHPAPTRAEIEALDTIFYSGGLALRQLGKPGTYFGKEQYSDAQGMNISLAFHQCVLHELTSEQLEEVIKGIGKDHPLVVAILQQAKDAGTDTRRQIAENFPQALDVLNQLFEDYQNPPKPAKK